MLHQFFLHYIIHNCLILCKCLQKPWTEKCWLHFIAFYQHNYIFFLYKESAFLCLNIFLELWINLVKILSPYDRNTFADIHTKSWNQDNPMWTNSKNGDVSVGLSLLPRSLESQYYKNLLARAKKHSNFTRQGHRDSEITMIYMGGSNYLPFRKTKQWLLK